MIHTLLASAPIITAPAAVAAELCLHVAGSLHLLSSFVQAMQTTKNAGSMLKLAVEKKKLFMPWPLTDQTHANCHRCKETVFLVQHRADACGKLTLKADALLGQMSQIASLFEDRRQVNRCTMMPSKKLV